MSVRKVMIVDDDKTFLEELEDIIISRGYQTIAITDSSTVLHAAYNEKPDVILLDLKMDKMNGFRIAQRLKGVPVTAHIPIIAMTGIFTSEDNLSFMNTCGIKSCLEKPFNPLDLIALIEETS
ncbi:MAG: response regulator [bacterium]